MSKEIVGFIFARGGSKGVPRKNIRLLAGRPLIAYAIDTALETPSISRVVVSTDDEEIAEVSRACGADVPFLRPPELASDSAPEWLAWQHAIREINADEASADIDIFVSVPPTSPLRSPEDVEACIRLMQDGNVDLVYTVMRTNHNPYFNMVVIDDSGYAHLAIPPAEAIHRRQDVPAVYDSVTAAYVAHPDFILNTASMFEGKIKAVIVPAERAVEIDSELDFMMAELLIEKQQQQGSGNSV